MMQVIRNRPALGHFGSCSAALPSCYPGRRCSCGCVVACLTRQEKQTRVRSPVDPPPGLTHDPAGETRLRQACQTIPQRTDSDEFSRENMGENLGATLGVGVAPSVQTIDQSWEFFLASPAAQMP